MGSGLGGAVAPDVGGEMDIRLRIDPHTPNNATFMRTSIVMFRTRTIRVQALNPKP